MKKIFCFDESIKQHSQNEPFKHFRKRFTKMVIYFTQKVRSPVTDQNSMRKYRKTIQFIIVMIVKT